ncbi:MAG: GYD domain-containing protein [Chloroflexota bacterium]|nr:GYD domain-containing protein [Chloroflexota bacterium]
MAKYMIQFSYTQEGLRGLLSEGGSKRHEATEDMVRSLGGKLLAYYFTFGEYDGFAIVDKLDNVEAATIAMTAAALGVVRTKTTVLLEPDEIDRVARKTLNYRPPGTSFQ